MHRNLKEELMTLKDGGRYVICGCYGAADKLFLAHARDLKGKTSLRFKFWRQPFSFINAQPYPLSKKHSDDLPKYPPFPYRGILPQLG